MGFESRLQWNAIGDDICTAGGNTRASLLSGPTLRALSPKRRGHSLESLTWKPTQTVTRSPSRTPPAPARTFPSEVRVCSPEPRGVAQSSLEVARPRPPNVPPLRLQSPDPPRSSLVLAPWRSDSVATAAVNSHVERCRSPTAVVRASSPMHVLRPASPTPPTQAINQAHVGQNQRAATVTWPFAANPAQTHVVVPQQNHSPVNSPVRRQHGNQIMSAGV